MDTKSAEYRRGYLDGYAMKDPEHIAGLPEPIYRPVEYPAYTDGHKAGRADRQSNPGTLGNWPAAEEKGGQ